MSFDANLFLFFGITVLLLFLPFLPALVEWHTPHFLGPLRVKSHARETTFFATTFAKIIRSYFPNGVSAETGTDISILERPTRILTEVDQDPSTPDEIRKGKCTNLTMSSNILVIPGKMQYSAEVYGERDILVGEECSFKALFAKGNLILGKNTMVRSWAHSDQSMLAGEDTQLLGRATATKVLRLLKNSYFEKLYAERIEFGNQTQAIFEKLPTPDRIRADNRRNFTGDVTIDSGKRFPFHIVATGNIFVRRGTQIIGSVKSHQNIFLEDGVLIAGSLIAEKVIQIGMNCRIRGPLLAELDICIGERSVVGTAEILTTTIAQKIRIREGCIVHGTVWPKLWGYVG